MSKGAHIILAFFLTALSGVLIYFNYQQNFTNDVGRSAVVVINNGKAVPIFTGYDVVDPKNAYRHLKPHRSTARRSSAQAHSQVELVNPLGDGLLGTGVSNTTSARSNPPQISRTSVSPIDLRRDVANASRNVSPSQFANEFSSVTRERVMAYQQLSAFQGRAPRASAENVSIGNSILSGNNQTKLSFNMDNTFDPLATDPGGDPDPGEMIPVPDGFLFLLILAFLYFIAGKFFYYKS